MTDLSLRERLEARETCPDCHGSGEQGLGYYDPCGTCFGQGCVWPEVKAAPPAADLLRGKTNDQG